MNTKIGKLVYVGDFGQVPLSEKTLQAYSVEFLDGKTKTWRRSKANRARVARFYSDLAAVQRYFWVRDEDRSAL